MAQVVFALGDDVLPMNLSRSASWPPCSRPKRRCSLLPISQINARLKSGTVPPGSVIVAGANFGCGSSREQAASTLKGYGTDDRGQGVCPDFPAELREPRASHDHLPGDPGGGRRRTRFHANTRCEQDDRQTVRYRPAAEGAAGHHRRRRPDRLHAEAVDGEVRLVKTVISGQWSVASRCHTDRRTGGRRTGGHAAQTKGREVFPPRGPSCCGQPEPRSREPRAKSPEPRANLVPIVIRLVRPFDRHADVVRLLRRQLVSFTPR